MARRALAWHTICLELCYALLAQSGVEYAHAPAAQQASLEDRGNDQAYGNSSIHPPAVRAEPSSGSGSMHLKADAITKAAAEQRQSLKTQAGALLRKNAQYQRRNIGTNLCLLASPIVFCVLLLVVQVALNKLLTGDDYKVVYWLLQ
eukprot:GHUV01048687.1.p1 GENE.GHUV01048687.1~~GHUV01048687.1.p1  ORF type:complete len:147 (+),score=50.20 GHUV01048687.1:540-980(+)